MNLKSKIDGVKIFKKSVITDDRGKILHMLKKNDISFRKFGEIYFSYVFPFKVKAWHLHKKMTLNYVAVYGKIKLVMYDDREKSKSRGIIEEFFLSNEEHCLITIPPMVWNGFCSMNNDLAILANCSDIPHNKNEIVRLDFDNPKIPYTWK